MPHKPHPEPYHVGDIVPKEGQYVCVPCGFKKTLMPGEAFSECLSCMKDEGWHASWDEQDAEDELADAAPFIEEREHHLHDEEGQEVAEGLELWEELQKPSEAAAADDNDGDGNDNSRGSKDDSANSEH